ncbi:hypothetical protein TNCV_3973981 [Trichonephila clavipes]|nr:hypothetical protein TNCV_3973981 [Trichonephila clavipes]
MKKASFYPNEPDESSLKVDFIRENDEYGDSHTTMDLHVSHDPLFRTAFLTESLSLSWKANTSERKCLQITIFMQVGATLHIGCQIKVLLNANFGDNRVISRHFPDAWPSRSPDLNHEISGCGDFKKTEFAKEELGLT